MATQPKAIFATKIATQPMAKLVSEMATQPHAIFAPEVATQPNAIFAPKRATQPTAIFAPKLATQPATIFVAEKAVQPRAILPPEMATQPGEALTSKMAIQLLGNTSLETRVKAIQPITDTGRCRQSSDSRSMNDPIRNTRRVISAAVASRAFSNSLRHAQTTEQLRLLSLNKALTRVGLQLPASPYPVSRKDLAGTKYLLNTPLQHALSEFIRRTRIPLPVFVELVRGQTKSDYRPNKNQIPDVLARLCKGYHNLDKLQTIAAEGVRVELTVDKPTQENLPVNHGSAVERVNILRNDVCKEQDA